jgi:ABC-type transport system substrate-binding protein
LSEELTKKGLQLVKEPGLDVTHETFNMADPILGKNKLLRQAINLAVDVGPMIDLFYNGRALAAQSPIPPGLLGYDAELKNPYRQFNLAKAKELLAKAGYPNGEGLAPIEYITTSSTTSRQMTEYLTKSLEAIGVKLKVETYSWPEFQNSIKNKRGQMWGMGWGADYPDAENFLQLFISKNASPGPNDANFSNAEFDQLYEKSLLVRNEKEREGIYKRMVKILVEECPWIVNTHRMTFALTQPWFKNFKPHEFSKNRAKYYRIDIAARTAAKK